MRYTASSTGRRKWQPEEIAAGVWLSLGMDTTDGIKEVTSRVFVSFDFQTSGPITGAYGRLRKFDGPFTYDVLVFAKMPAGGPVDIAYNGEPMQVNAGGTADITVKWDGLRERESVARQIYLDRHAQELASPTTPRRVSKSGHPTTKKKKESTK